MKELTGRHVLAIFGGGFAVIIAVNIALAVSAVRTFPGLETANSYVASQVFDARRAAQDALGWDVSLDYDGDRLTLAVADAGGAIEPRIVSAILGRPTHVADDFEPAFAWNGTALVADASLAPGIWDLRLKAEAADGTPYARRLEFRVRR